MTDFIRCPFCSGHEVISTETADLLIEWIDSNEDWRRPKQVQAELENIRNSILNHREREQEQEPLLPICPTPDKAKYASREHSHHNAIRYRQHPYQCECGYWHLSKQSGVEHTAKINAPAATADEFDPIDPLLE